MGWVGVGVRLGHPAPVSAANGDRFEEYVMCTGACAVSPRAPTDGVWLLDYRAGKLLGTVIDRTQFGITWNAPMPDGSNALADEVTLKADLSLVKAA